jgi:hypothetical protein
VWGHYKDVLTTPRFIVIKEKRLDQSDQGYNDPPEQVMVDVRYWHLADINRRSWQCLL